MKKVIFGFCISAVIAIPCFSQTVAEGVPVTKEGREVFAAIAKWADAVKIRDTKALDGLFEEGLIVTTPGGLTRNKTEEIDVLKPNGKNRIVSVKNDDVRVRVFGTTAVATALCRMHFAQTAGPDVQMSFRYTAVFVNKDGRWQLAALQTTQPLNP